MNTNNFYSIGSTKYSKSFSTNITWCRFYSKSVLASKILILLFVIVLTPFNSYCQTVFGGLGITFEINPQNHFPYITSVTKGMPAEKMNLAENDYITKINGNSTYNSSMETIVSSLRGNIGSYCNITIWRNNIEYSLTFQRAKIIDNSCNIYTEALPDFTSFTWSGNCVNGYADGYGKLQLIKDGYNTTYYIGYMRSGKLCGNGTYYYANGSKMLEGTFRNNCLNGLGNSYDQNGNLKIEGYFENDKLFNISDINSDFGPLANEIVDNVFDGGTNIKSKLVGLRRYDNSTSRVTKNNCIIEIQISFNGNIIQSNYYEITLRIQGTVDGTSYNFIDANEMALGYGLSKLGIKLGMLAKKLDALSKY